MMTMIIQLIMIIMIMMKIVILINTFLVSGARFASAKQH